MAKQRMEDLLSDGMDIYQQEARMTAIYPKESALEYLALGLSSESGEVAGKVKKLLRDGVLDKEALAHELGDVLWYLSMLSYELGSSLGEVASHNLKKLEDRAARGALQGNGDYR